MTTNQIIKVLIVNRVPQAVVDEVREGLLRRENLEKKLDGLLSKYSKESQDWGKK